MIFKSNAKPKVPSVVPHDQALIDAWVYERFDLFVHKVIVAFLQVISEGKQDKSVNDKMSALMNTVCVCIYVCINHQITHTC